MKKLALSLLLVAAILVGLMAVFPEDATRIAFSMERLRSGVHPTSLVVDGRRWHYLEGGSADAPAALLLHGFGGDKDNWTRFSNYLTDDFRVIAPDLPGFGDSVRHADWDYSLSAQRERLTAFVEAVGLDRFHIVGNSMGGHLAALYTHQNPEQIRSLALFNNAGVAAPTPSEVQLAVERGESPLILSSPADFDRLVALVSHKPPFIPWPAKRVVARQAFEHAAFNQTIFDTYKAERDIGLEPILPEIDAPVLILWGEYDRVLDVSSVDTMRPLLPQAEVVIMRDTGHVPMLERPAETAGHFRAFVDSL